MRLILKRAVCRMSVHAALLAVFFAVMSRLSMAQVARLEAEDAQLQGPTVHVVRPVAGQPGSDTQSSTQQNGHSQNSANTAVQSVPAQNAATQSSNAPGAKPQESAPPDTGFSGSGYVAGLKEDADRVVFTYQAAKAGAYDFKILYRCAKERGYEVRVNDVGITGTFPGSPIFAVQQMGKVELKAGANTIIVGHGWGEYDLDAIELSPSGPIEPPLKIIAKPSDPNATPQARALLAKIDDIYGHGALLGVYSDDDAKYVVDTTGFRPAIMGGDLSSYSPAAMERKPHESEIVERLIQYAKEGYIITLSWHWVPPFGLLNRMIPGDDGKPPIDARYNRGFYTNATNFDVSIAMDDPASLERADLLRDIDAIAVQLKKFDAAGVPVLWRPLHEAQGGWFWWGAKGPKPFVQLWQMMFDRLVNVDGVHNLIWVYTSANDLAWYPGDAYVDVVGIDAYPKDLEDPQSSLWAELSGEYAGRKPLAISEFGGVPDVEEMQRLGNDWVYAVSWSGVEGPKKSAPEALKRIYAGDGALKQKAP